MSFYAVFYIICLILLFSCDHVTFENNVKDTSAML